MRPINRSRRSGGSRRLRRTGYDRERSATPRDTRSRSHLRPVRHRPRRRSHHPGCLLARRFGQHCLPNPPHSPQHRRRRRCRPSDSRRRFQPRPPCSRPRQCCPRCWDLHRREGRLPTHRSCFPHVLPARWRRCCPPSHLPRKPRSRSRQRARPQALDRCLRSFVNPSVHSLLELRVSRLARNPPLQRSASPLRLRNVAPVSPAHRRRRALGCKTKGRAKQASPGLRDLGQSRELTSMTRDVDQLRNVSRPRDQRAELN